jgi:hypothetical protein
MEDAKCVIEGDRIVRAWYLGSRPSHDGGEAVKLIYTYRCWDRSQPVLQKYRARGAS